MCKVSNVIKRVQNSLLAVLIIVGGCLVSMPSYALWGEILGAVGGVVGSIIPVVGTTIGSTIGGIAGGMIDGGGSPSFSGGGGGATPASGNSDADIVRQSLQAWKDNNQQLYAQHKQLVDSILQANDRQMTQLLQLQRNQLDQMVNMNNDSRRDFLAALDKEGARFERIVDKFKDYAAQGRVLDHETIMELLTGSREEREAMYQRHKVELDRMAVEYNEKVNAANAERDAAMKQLTDMTASFNRQSILAQIAHAACSQSVDDIAWCGIRYRNNPEKCTALEDKKRILCE